MAKKIFIFISALMWLVPMVGEESVSASAEEVVRLIPLAGTAQDVPVASLRKIVFTADSIVFVPKELNSLQMSDVRCQNSAVYKYDYRAMLFVATEPADLERVGFSEPCEGVKFIQDGRLYIRRDDKIYDVLGQTIRN